MKIYYKLNGYKCWNSVVTSTTSSSYLCELYGQSRCVQRNMLAFDVFFCGLVTCNYLCLAGRESSLHETTIGYRNMWLFGFPGVAEWQNWATLRCQVPCPQHPRTGALNAHPEWCGSVVFWGFCQQGSWGDHGGPCNQHHDGNGSVWKRDEYPSVMAIPKKYPKHDFLMVIKFGGTLFYFIQRHLKPPSPGTTALRAKIRSAQYEYWHRGDDLWLHTGVLVKQAMAPYLQSKP